FGHGGGIYNAGNAKITSCVFDDNHVNNPSFHGGGIYNSSIFQLISSSVNDNSSAGMGGGIMNDATLTVLASTISNNLSTAAGGGIASQGRANFFSSTISNNDAGTSGGGIYSSATVLISRCTITENESGSNGGGIFSSDSLTFFNTIIAGNAADNQGPEIFNSSGTPVSSGYNVVRDIAQSGFIPLPSDTAGTTANPVEALLGPLQNNGGTLLTHEPLCGSPAIDNGDTTGAPSTDQRGLPRIHGKGIDIGSVETQFDDITIQAVINNVSAPGNADGSIQLLVTGGTEPYFYLWNNGSQTHTITGLSAGGYSVTVTDLKGCDASAIFTVNVANGILEALGKVSLTLFPNPAQDFIFIQTEKKQISLIFFYNTDGKVVKKAECSGFTELIKLPVTELPKGIYRVLVKYENGNFAAGRFVKGE
ncbi:MAG TPA: choice-of-anchor Q domain-containing protein, partial [Chitinophagales bacterium]|nr:choice-of-anchor Q domain-containing protein [Chitinophagales bacterium]